MQRIRAEIGLEHSGESIAVYHIMFLKMPGMVPRIKRETINVFKMMDEHLIV